MKTRTRKHRVWLNSSKNNCMAALNWYVTVGWDWRKGNDDRLNLDAEFSVNDEGQTHWVTRRAELRPLYKVQKELNAFLTECEAQLTLIEEHNKDVRSKKANT